MEYLHKRDNGNFYFKRKVPLDLIKQYGKEVITFSLRTKDRKIAAPLVRKWSVHFDNEFEAKRKVKTPKSKRPPTEALPPPLIPMNIDQLIALRVEKMRAAREKAFKADKLEDWTSQHRTQLKWYREYLETGEEPIIGNISITEAEIFVHAASHILEGKPLPYMPILGERQATQNASSQATKAQASRSHNIDANTLHIITNKWAKERKPVARTVKHVQRIIAIFEEITGVSDVTLITKKTVIAFKDKLLEEGSANVRINGYLTHLRTLFNFAIEQDIISSNPANAIKLPNDTLARDSRYSFDIESLNRIFASPVYTSSFRPKGGAGEAAFWIPLLALYAGARREELSQLLKQDIYEAFYQDQSGIQQNAWVLRITDDDDRQKLKNPSSRRIVPIHPKLIELGFIDYVKRQTDNEFIFPLLNPSKVYKERGANWGKWFMKYLRETIGITDPKLVFHSFRHTFKDYARASGIGTEVHHALTGHSMGNVGDNYGGKNYPLNALVVGINQYSIPNLKIGTTNKI